MQQLQVDESGRRFRVATHWAGFFAALALIALIAAPVAAKPAVLWGPLEPGPHEVGFRRLWQIDESRVWERSPSLASLDGVVGRPIRIDLWYPAQCGDRKAMPFREYLEAKPPDEAFRDMADLLAQWDGRSYRKLTGDAQRYDALMRTPTGACLDPPAAEGRYPLILYSAGWYNRSPDNTVLAEFLASHGFVVATVPQLNPGLWTFDFRSHPAAVETQMRDLEVAFGATIREPFVDRRRVATAGYSTGGNVALMLQGRNPMIRAVVGLDPSFAFENGEDVSTSPHFGLDRNRVPILVLRRPDENGRTDFPKALDALAFAQRLFVVVPHAEHGTFGDDPPILHSLGTGNPESFASHANIGETTLRFLAHVLAADPTPLTPDSAKELVGSWASAQFRDAAPVPDTNGWERVVEEAGLEKAAQRAAELQQNYPRLEIVREREMNSLGYRRLREDKPGVAVDLFRLNALAHPHSANAFDSLADGCLAMKDQECAIEAYRSLLEILPSDPDLPNQVKDRMHERAEQWLREHGVDPAKPAH